MTLPKFTTNESTFFINIPSIDKKYPFRRMKVSDEKTLLIAKQSEDQAEIYSAILQVIKNCCVDSTLNIDSLTLFDIELIFLKLRGQSISNIIKMSIVDEDDNKQYQFTIDIDKINVSELKTEEQFKITTDDNKFGVIMKYPPSDLYNDKVFLTSETQSYSRLIIKCVDKIFDQENTYSTNDYKEQELIEWLDDLDIPTFNKIEQFVNTVPTVFHEIKYTNSLGQDKTILLSTLTDFFMLR